jgi:hypothetical protein
LAKKYQRLAALAFFIFLLGCVASPGGLGTPPASAVLVTGTPPAVAAQATEATASAPALRLYVSPAVPLVLSDSLQLPGNVVTVEQRQQADFSFEAITPQNAAGAVALSHWVYALVAPFPTVLDGVSLEELEQAWKGKSPPDLEGGILRMTAETRAVFTALWGKPAASGVQTVAADQLLEMSWAYQPAWALVPFEDLSPRWKVLQVEYHSPLESGEIAAAYPLVVRFGLVPVKAGSATTAAEPLQALATNRDPAKMTTLVMTGTTALVRNTALRMEEEGIDYPALDIGNWLRSTDLTHISNEVPFYTQCPPAEPLRREMRFCSDPSYIGLLQAVGANIIELTGNHVLDWGTDAFLYTLDLYRQNQMPYYGGGENLADARKPLLVKHNGNRLAFIGCNPMGPANILATDDRPGAASCDLDWMTEQVQSLLQEGYLPIVTFQHFEIDTYQPQSGQRHDFQRMAEAGAVIVSGSQAHFPQAMTFEGDRFVHYGLGNLFFDQMSKGNRRTFIDRHIFYDGRYISTELLTAVLEDYARPRPMTSDEREAFLSDVFAASEW